MPATARFLSLCALALLTPATALAGPESLYDGPKPAPGPDILYAKPRPPAPQLKNAGPWRARPILISGASAYRRGEFLYQDYLYDDHGARGILRDPGDPRLGDDSFSAPGGTYTYPTNVAAYRNNIADLVELRVKASRSTTLFRLTYNSMTKPRLVATTIALGGSGETHEFPYKAGVSAPAVRFLTVRGRNARLSRPAAGDGQIARPEANVSKRRRQITVKVPRAIWNPGGRSVRIAAATGLWDRQAGTYLQPGNSATASTPGGAIGLADPPAIFNVAFRYAEPLPDVQDIPGTLLDTAWWREKAQGAALADDGDISEFFAKVNFRKLRRGRSDRMLAEPRGTPSAGPMNRILSSRFADGQGVDYEVTGCGGVTGCTGQYLGRLQPYAIYVPRKPTPRRGFGLTLLLRSLGASYNQFLGTRNQSQFGERARGSIVITTENRGPDGWYYGKAGAEVFEAWADVARRFKLDPSRSALGGYSMGGYATYKLGSQFPDLFAAGQPTVGPAGLGIGTAVGEGSSTTPMLPSLRHVPIRMWVGALDELVPIPTTIAHAQAADAAGLRYAFDVFTLADHFALAVNDQYEPAAEFLGDRRVVRNPAHVTYVRNPSMDFPGLGFKADHAYWLSGIRVRDEGARGGLGRVDAVSEAFGRGDPPVLPTQNTAGVLAGGFFPALPFTEQSQAWGPAPKRPKADELVLDLANIDRIRVHVRRARLSCDPEIEVTSNAPAQVILVGCGRKIAVG